MQNELNLSLEVMSVQEVTWFDRIFNILLIVKNFINC